MLAPEIFAKKIEKEAILAFDELDAFYLRREALQSTGVWPDWAALPADAGYDAVYKRYGINTSNPARYVMGTLEVEAAYLWRGSKQIFAFDDTLEQELLNQSLTGNIPGDVLLRLPVPCVYVQLHAQSKVFDSAYPMDGFFAWLRWDSRTKTKELGIVALDANGEHCIAEVCPINGTVKASVKMASVSSALHNIRQIVDTIGYDARLFNKVVSQNNYESDARRFNQILNLLLYLCTDEPDYDNQPRRVKAKPTYTTYTPERPPRRTNVTNVGTRIGAAIRLDRQKVKELNDEAEPQQSEHRKHASPVAHIRRGHYHSFWTGAKESVDRKIVVKWLPPMLINGDKGEIAPTIRPVK